MNLIHHEKVTRYKRANAAVHLSQSEITSNRLAGHPVELLFLQWPIAERFSHVYGFLPGHHEPYRFFPDDVEAYRFHPTTAPTTLAPTTYTVRVDTHSDTETDEWREMPTTTHREFSDVLSRFRKIASVGVLMRGEAFLVGFLNQLSEASFRWESPHLSRCEDDGVALEWWNEERKLIVFIDDEDTDCLYAWGPDMDDEMEYKELSSSSDILHYWSRLMGG